MVKHYNTPKKPNHSKVENSIIKKQGVFTMKKSRYTDIQIVNILKHNHAVGMDL